MTIASFIRRIRGNGRSARDSTGTDARIRSSQIAAVIEDVLQQLHAGEQVDDAEIERRHPHLMPELDERLRALRMIEDARRRAAKYLDSADIGESDDLFTEELLVLRDALTGYELLDRIHYGGQGVVYEAVQRSTGRTVALKVLVDGPLASARQRYRFAREVDLLSRIQHPNIVTLYDSGVVRGRPYFAMELIEGLPIDDYVLLHAPALEDLLRLFTTTCRAVNTAHQRGIIHRDLKPSNILVDGDGRPHVLDFGLAKDLQISEGPNGSPTVSLPGQVVGTLPYLSPEQVEGLDEQVDVRADIYALGVVLFQLLTGAFPYPVDGSSQAVRANIVSREPTPLRKALSDESFGASAPSDELDDELEAIVLKALEKDRARRYQSADALADDLDRHSAGDPVEAKADRRLYLLKKTLRRYRIHASVAAAFLLILTGGLIGTTLMWRRAENVARTAQAGLQMGAYLKDGSVHRDQDRVDQAIAMLEKAIEIGESVPTSDPVVRRYLYGAHHRLAELYFESGKLRHAASHCDAAITLAEDLAPADLSDVESRRLLGFAHELRARMAFSQNEWQLALTHYGKAASIYEDLLSLRPNNLSLKSDLAVTLERQGSCLRRLNLFDESLQKYTAAHEVYTQRLELEPDVVDHAVDLSRTEIRLAVWHLSRRTREDDKAASQWLESADAHLSRLRDSGPAPVRKWDIEKLIGDIRANKDLILRRAKKYAQAADQSGS